MGAFLFILSVLLAGLLFPMGFVYSSVKLGIKANFKTWFERMNQYVRVIAISIDQLGNVIMQELFNDLLIKKGKYDIFGIFYPNSHKFGNEDETLSSVLGKNEQNNSLSKLGKIVAFVLNKLDNSHTTKSIEHGHHNAE